MFREHKFTIWGTYCKCGNECSILQNEYHPWDDTLFIVKLKCSLCNNEVIVDTKSAKKFYDNKIYSYYDGIYGNIIDLGCGGGFLSRYLLGQKNITKVWGLDVDEDCIGELSDIIGKNEKFKFKNYNGLSFYNIFIEDSIDFLVSRDVFMFIEDTDRYFNEVSKIVNKGIKQMGWYIENNKRMNNKLTPDEIVREYSKRGWTVNIEYLDWYKSGYFINAYKF